MKNQNQNKDFFEKVYEITRQIPYGKATSYGAIARYIGSPQAARMVGWALNNSHLQKKYVPAHRVVNKDGVLTGKLHFGNSNTMQQLIENEGLSINNNQITDFKKHFWNPNIAQIIDK
ncbi:MAG: MGMT family protein [Bacteroidales bacterium]|nr:MGMT family protein [Bacteroidales bacterium]